MAELAEIVGKTPETIRAWTGRGCPVVERGDKRRPRKFNTASIFAWIEDGGPREGRSTDQVPDEKELRRRNIFAESMMAELELARRLT